jgi:transposase
MVTAYNGVMFIRPCYRTKDGKRHAYWALVESYRSARGPRQRTVAYLGQLDRAERLGIQQAAQGHPPQGYQRDFFDGVEPQWVEVDLARVRVERALEFGGPWLAVQLLEQLGLSSVFKALLPEGREEIPWALMGLVLVIARFCDPSSELYIAEHFYKRTALYDLLGVAAQKVDDDRLYRALDKLLPHKAALEKYLKERLGQLFDLDYDLLLYDVTSTYFEGLAKGNPLAQYGYSRDHRGDCKQVCIALVVTRGGLPLGYELFAGNRADATTLEQIVETMEQHYGRAHRIWVMDRGLVSQENIEYLKHGGRRYIVGTPKSLLKRYEQALLKDDWRQVHEGLEVKTCPSPQGDEVFILCRSQDRRQKEKAIHQRFERRLEEGLMSLEQSCAMRKYKPVTIAKRLGRLLGRYSRAAGLFRADVIQQADGRAMLVWETVEAWRDWASLSEGCYLLRTNLTDWGGEDLWKAYMQLTDAEAAFRIHKSDLRIRPIWHQRQDRVEAHILVCFLAYVLWKTLAQMCRQKGLGDEPRRVIDELSRIRMVDVVLPTRCGQEIRRRCIAQPSDHQAVLLQRLSLSLPSYWPVTETKTKEM